MKRTESAEVRFSSGKAVEPNIYRSKYAAVHRLYSRVKGGGDERGGGTESADPRNFSAKSVDAAIERSAVRLQLCFESVICTIVLPKSESITFIGSANPLKLLFKSAIRTKFLPKSADPQTLSPSPVNYFKLGQVQTHT